MVKMLNASHISTTKSRKFKLNLEESIVDELLMHIVEKIEIKEHMDQLEYMKLHMVL
jgi:hypothetical protein